MYRQRNLTYEPYKMLDKKFKRADTIDLFNFSISIAQIIGNKLKCIIIGGGIDEDWRKKLSGDFHIILF